MVKKHQPCCFSEKLVHADLDERALDALKEFPVDGALTVLKQFVDSNLEHVSNKSAFLCGVMKTYRQKSKAQGMFLLDCFIFTLQLRFAIFWEMSKTIMWSW